jgi:hypothetical protein
MITSAVKIIDMEALPDGEEKDVHSYGFKSVYLFFIFIMLVSASHRWAEEALTAGRHVLFLPVSILREIFYDHESGDLFYREKFT